MVVVVEPEDNVNKRKKFMRKISREIELNCASLQFYFVLNTSP